jgi:hypothetical protein
MRRHHEHQRGVPVGERHHRSGGTPVVTCAATADIRDAEDLMARERKSRLVVTDADGRLVGVLSLSTSSRRRRVGARWTSDDVEVRDTVFTGARRSRDDLKEFPG